jgi:holo-[acyl-carrier protein] synthase
MILGIGTDMVDSRRLARWLQRFDDQRLARVFHATELAEYRTRPNPTLFLASRFAAKEALAKAFGTGIGAQLRLNEIRVVALELGKPALELSGQSQHDATIRFGAPNSWAMHVSLSTEDPYALAFVVLTRC